MTLEKQWWKAKKPNESIFAVVNAIDEDQPQRAEAMLRGIRKYANRDITNLSGRAMSEAQQDNVRVFFNVTKNCIDSVVSQIATSKTGVQFLTIKGDLDKQKQAEGLNKFIAGQFYENKYYELVPQILKDACCMPSGYLYVYRDGSKLKIERVFPYEILFNEEEARQGPPKQLFRILKVQKYALQAAYPKFKAEIDTSRVLRNRDDEYDMENLPDECTLVYAWHLPTKGKPGRFVTCVQNAVLEDKEWKRDTFPFVKLDWTTSPIGWEGLSLREEIEPIQNELNFLGHKVQQAMNLSVPRVFVPKGAHIRPMTNDVWEVIEFAGSKPPIMATPPSISGEFFNQIDRLVGLAYDISGVSRMSASGQKPAGMDSGEAMKTYHEIKSQRFLELEHRIEEFTLDVAEQLITCAKEALASGTKLTVLAQGDKDIELVDFSEVNIEKNKYSMRAWPVSILPDSPAGKVDTVTKLSQAVPEIQPHLLTLLSDIPDLDQMVSYLDAPKKLARMQVDMILREGKMAAPVPEMDLGFTRLIASQALCKALVEEYPDAKVELLRRYIKQVDQMQALAQQPMMPPMGAGPMGAPQPAGPGGAEGPMGAPGTPPAPQQLPPPTPGV